jgi:hypothetical protein
MSHSIWKKIDSRKLFVMMKPPAIQYEIRPQNWRHALIGITNFMGAHRLTTLPWKAVLRIINKIKIGILIKFAI